MSKSFEEFHKYIVENIKRERLKRKLTQEDMNEGGHISYRTYVDIENMYSVPTLKSIYGIAKRFGVEPSKLLKKPT